MTAFIFTLIAGALRVLCIMFGWNWFVADPFNAPELGFLHAWGLMLLAQALTAIFSKNIVDNPTNIESYLWAIMLSITWAIILGLMWLIHYFLPL